MVFLLNVLAVTLGSNSDDDDGDNSDYSQISGQLISPAGTLQL